MLDKVPLLSPTHSYLFGFTTGSLLGITATYLLMRLRRQNRLKAPTTTPVEERYDFPPLADEYRLVMGIRTDLKMQKGKVAAQCGHAAVAAYAKALQRQPKVLRRWLKFGGTKITVKVDGEAELLALDKAAKALDVLSSVVRDAGQTQVAPGTRTVIAIGPAPKSALDQLTGHLKLY